VESSSAAKQDIDPFPDIDPLDDRLPLGLHAYSLDRAAVITAGVPAVIGSEEVSQELTKLEQKLGSVSPSLDLEKIIKENADAVWQGLPPTAYTRSGARIRRFLTHVMAAQFPRDLDVLIEYIRQWRVYYQTLTAIEPVLRSDSRSALEAYRKVTTDYAQWAARHSFITAKVDGAVADEVIRSRPGIVARFRALLTRSAPERSNDSDRDVDQLQDAAEERNRSVHAINDLRRECTARQKILIEKAVEYARSSLAEFVALETEWDAAREELLSSVRSNILRVIRAGIAELIGRDDAGEMQLASDGGGLSDPDLDRPPYLTASFGQVESIIATRKGASIGVSGPRGAGKSTLIRHVCLSPGPSTVKASDREDDHATEEQTALPAPDLLDARAAGEKGSRLGIVLSAPVRYEPQEFVVHLHQQLCLRILGERPSMSLAGTEALEAQRGWLQPVRWQFLLIFSVAAISAGVALILVGLFAHAPALVGPARISLLLLGLAAVLAFVAGALTGRGMYYSDFGTILWAFVAVSYAVGAALGITEIGLRSIAPPLIASALVLAGCAGLAMAFKLRYRERWLEHERIDMFHRELRSSSGAGVQHSPHYELAQVARAHLEELRYLVSYSAESSATLKAGSVPTVPVGLEAKTGRGTSWAPNPRTYPEVVASLQQLLTTMGQWHTVMIGIDELDKMRSAEDVELFLNEIKSIFGVRNCFFIVSVSEDAAAGFERRGVPFRDVFDSCFDEIVALQHLEFLDSRRLLANEVGAWARPFVTLCHVLSGGLPRDLLRTARLVVASAEADRHVRIGPTTTQLIEADLTGRSRAISHEVRKLVEDESARTLYALLPSPQLDASALTAQAERLLAFANISPLPDAALNGHEQTGKTSRHAEQLRRLATELAATLLLNATLVQFFSENYSSERMARAEDASEAAGASIELLAEARRSLGINPWLAMARLDTFNGRPADARLGPSRHDVGYEELDLAD
jgi:hypothetical protein